MKKFFLLLTLIILFLNLSYTQGLENLADKAGNSIKSFFKIHKHSKSSVLSLQNHSVLNDFEIQQFYQLFVSKFDNEDYINFEDLFLNFSNNRGIFNKSRIKDLDFLISLNFINKMGKIGVGVVIFSRKFDRIVSVRYFENKIGEGEKLTLKHINYSFKDTGFKKQYDMNLHGNLLDVISVKIIINESTIKNLTILFYLNKISVYNIDRKSIKKLSEISMKWERPFYSAHKYEGRAFYFKFNDKHYISIGGNFSKKTKLFTIDLKTNQLIPGRELNIIPIRKLTLNRNIVLMGVNFYPGKNFFLGKIYLMNLSKSNLYENEIYEKKISEFYSITVLKIKNVIKNINTIDLDYKLRVYDEVFNNIYTSPNKYGYSLGSFNDKWIVNSSYTKGSDIINFFKTGSAMSDPQYSNKIDGEINFISPGYFVDREGVWVKIEDNKNTFTKTKLQFWSKNIE